MERQKAAGRKGVSWSIEERAEAMERRACLNILPKREIHLNERQELRCAGVVPGLRRKLRLLCPGTCRLEIVRCQPVQHPFRNHKARVVRVALLLGSFFRRSQRFLGSSEI